MKLAAALCLALAIGAVATSVTCPSCIDIYKPVCGNDAQTYNNECELKRSRCTTPFLDRLVVAHEGECAEDDRDFLCDMACDKHFEPVCGSDGQTYGNPCMLQVAACHARRVITMVYPGECSSAPEVPDDDDTTGPVDLLCPEFCTTEYQPICANDGKTYANACDMFQIACRLKIDLKAVHHGSCKSEETACSAKPCAEDEQCIDEPKECFTQPCEQFRCVKVIDVICDHFCIESYEPVCGTDGNTHPNMCQLDIADCRNRAGNMRGVKPQPPRFCPCLCNRQALSHSWSFLVAAAQSTKLTKEAFAKALADLPAYEVDSMFEHADENGDGEITAAEYAALQAKQGIDSSEDGASLDSAETQGSGGAAPISLYAILGIAVAGVAITVMVATVIVLGIRKARAGHNSHQRLVDDAYAENQYEEVPVEDALERSF